MKGGIKTEKYSEKRVVDLWLQQASGLKRLRGADGNDIEIIYPGRLNDGRGADFTDAVIRTSGEIHRGDIEVHVRSSGWREHGHNLDPDYNRVILHVVLRYDGCPAKLQNGREIPVISLERVIEETGHSSSSSGISVPCRGIFGAGYDEQITGIIEEAGEDRFYERASVFRNEMEPTEAGEVLYRGMMRALGYSRNIRPFEELSKRLPLRVLEQICGKCATDEEYLSTAQALLLKTAGLQEGQTDFPCVTGESMSPDDWDLYRVRPGNSPVRRLTAMSLILFRYHHKGFENGVIDLLRNTPEECGHRRLEAGLCVSGLGAGRASDIIINSLLPFTFAFGEKNGRHDLSAKALNLYRFYPGADLNSVEKHMIAQLGLDRNAARSAVIRQGLIHIYRKFCITGGCRNCLLSQFEAGKHVKTGSVSPSLL